MAIFDFFPCRTTVFWLQCYLCPKGRQCNNPANKDRERSQTQNVKAGVKNCEELHSDLNDQAFTGNCMTKYTSNTLRSKHKDVCAGVPNLLKRFILQAVVPHFLYLVENERHMFLDCAHKQKSSRNDCGYVFTSEAGRMSA